MKTSIHNHPLHVTLTATAARPLRALGVALPLMAILFVARPGLAQSIGISDFGTNAPVPGANDISQLLTAGMTSGANAQDGLNYYSDTTAPGQTFTTGSNPDGYVINGIYVKTGGLDSGGGGATTAQSYTLRLYSVSGDTATLLSTYVTTNTVAFTDGAWLLYSGAFTNVLQPNSVYAYTHHRNSTGWDLMGYDMDNPYAGGQMAVIPAAGGTIAFGTSGSGDAAFDVALSPTPSTLSIYQQPVSQTVTMGQAASFSVGVLGVNPSYQWYTCSDAHYANASPIPNAKSSTYSISAAAVSDATNYFVVVTNAATMGVTSTVATLTVRLSVNSLAWLGSTSFNWDTTTPNWSNTVSLVSGVVYQTGDNVHFTDAGNSASPISLTGPLAPSSVGVLSSSNYTFAGSGSLAGSVQLSKGGTGTLTINNANTFRGSTVVSGGILQLGNADALGAATNAVTVNGGTLDINGVQGPASLQYAIQGSGYTNAGAIANFGGSAQNENGIHGLSLLGDATVGAVGRWDLYGTAGSTGLHGNKHNLTKVGPGSVFFIDGGTNNQLEDITVLNGTIGFQGTNNLGDPTKTIRVLGGGLAFYAAAVGVELDKNLVLSNAFFSNAGGDLTLDTPITLLGTNTQEAGYQESSSIQNNFNGPISGTGGWVINSIELDMLNGTNTYTGPTILNSAALLTLGANSSLDDSSLIQLGNANASVDLTSTPGLVRGNGQILAGIGNNTDINFGGIYGNVTCNAGSIISPGVNGPGTLSILGSLTLSGATNVVELGSDPTQVGNGVNDLLTVGGNLTLNGVNRIQIVPVAPLSSVSPYTIMTYGGSLTGGAANLMVSSGNPRYTLSVVDPATTPGSIQIEVTGVPTPLVWKGGQSPSPDVWNHTVPNFFNTGTSAYDHFYDGDLVTFNDTAVTNTVDVSELVVPGQLTLANNTTAYTFVGDGNIGGTLDKEGSGTVTLAITKNLALNTISNNLGTLVLNPPTNSTLAARITGDSLGNGAIVKAGTNILTLSGNNTNYFGTLSVTNGILRYTASTALGGSTNVYATNGGSLDINNVDTGNQNIAIAGSGYNGQGALVDLTTTWPAWPYQIVHNVTLLGDATIGANARWDVTGGSFVGNDHNLTKVGGSQVTLVDLGATSLKNVDIAAGNLTFQGTTDMGDPGQTLTVHTNASLGFWAGANLYNKNIVVINGTITSGGSSNALTGMLTLDPGTNNLYTSVDFGVLGPISGAGGFIKQGGGSLWLYGANTYEGPTVIGQNSSVIVGPNSSLGTSSLIEIDGGSTLDVTAPASFDLGAGQTLIGNGTLRGGQVTFGSGSTLSVGFTGGTAALNVTGNLTLQSGSTNVVDVNKTTTVANDTVIGLTSVTMGGTLVINNLGNALAGGDAIQLFSATNYSGSLSRIIPASPGPGLAWDTSTLDTDGTLRVVAVALPEFGTVSVSDGNFVFDGSGGSPGDSYSVLSQTNLAEPLANWTVVGGGKFDGSGNFSFTNAFTPGTTNRFFMIRVP